jgi:hypothetical protein
LGLRLKMNHESSDPAGADNASYSWRLTTEAFLVWKRLIEATQRAWKAEKKERYHRLVTLSTKAWQRYVRRWSRARNLPQ